VEEAKTQGGRIEYVRTIAKCLYLLLDGDPFTPTNEFVQEAQTTNPWAGETHKKWFEYTEYLIEEESDLRTLAVELESALPDILGQIEYALSEFSLRVLQTRLTRFYSNCDLEFPMELPPPRP